MSNYNFFEEYYPNDDYRETAQVFENYLNNIDTETNNAFGQYLVDSAQYETNGSPASEFVKEARRFVGQSIIDGNFDFNNFQLSGAEPRSSRIGIGVSFCPIWMIGSLISSIR